MSALSRAQKIALKYHPQKILKTCSMCKKSSDFNGFYCEQCTQEVFTMYKE